MSGHFVEVAGTEVAVDAASTSGRSLIEAESEAVPDLQTEPLLLVAG